ncbi:helix-turn-helix domain-containing protein [Amycolatopsis sp. TNS106]|uniref:helix-turn-helix domain-containing protein n=1 Tax=Amycolatopsis sp. TNS106 TaxID=2861750 RepID=UPI001C582426|nr:helix-turn-helix domain-containing protein [Amycolatopsis sp. TNS106]QXV63510.1 hypothetical protein CVV72_40840 [Amycolatopsis sp. TNS106]
MSSEPGNATEPPRRLRAYRFALDPTTTQLDTLAQHAGAARWAFNHALAQKLDALHRRQLQIDELVTLGYPEQLDFWIFDHEIVGGACASLC